MPLALEQIFRDWGKGPDLKPGELLKACVDFMEWKPGTHFVDYGDRSCAVRICVVVRGVASLVADLSPIFERVACGNSEGEVFSSLNQSVRPEF